MACMVFGGCALFKPDGQVMYEAGACTNQSWGSEDKLCSQICDPVSGNGKTHLIN